MFHKKPVLEPGKEQTGKRKLLDNNHYTLVKYDPWTSPISITWELTKNGNSLGCLGGSVS